MTADATPGADAPRVTETNPGIEPANHPKYDLGVLFVHGIGTQTLGSTLSSFGTPLFEWIQARAANVRSAAVLGETVLSVSGDEPAFAELVVASGKIRRWLLAESWWAESFPKAAFRDVAEWSLVIVPWTIGTHFARRWARKRSFPLISRITAVMALVGGLLLSPAVLLLLSILLVLGRIPWPQLQNVVANIQLTIASSIGDSYMLLKRPIEAAAIRGRLRRDLAWMLTRCSKVAVVAHSQGGAIACQVLSTGSSGPYLLITFGSGLRKLEELAGALGRGSVMQGALLSVAGLILAGLAIAVAPQVIYEAYTGTASITATAMLAAFAVVGLLLGVAGIQDFIHARAPYSLTKFTTLLALKGIQWDDVFSSADPVPNGKLHDDDRKSPASTEVVNLGSILKDHTSYWQNRDEFVPLVAEKLLAFDAALPLLTKEETAFVRAHRRIRVGMLQALGWITLTSVAAALVRHREAWLSLLAWVSSRFLTWAGGFVGLVPEPVDIPDAAVWSQSLGWVTAVLATSWLTRVLWALWNTKAMDDAQRGVYRVREPLAVLVALFVQLTVAATAVIGSEYGFWIAAVVDLVVLIGVSVAQVRHRAPSLRSSDVKETTSSPMVVLRALWNLFQAAIVILVVPIGLFLAALDFQPYLATRVGVPASWAVAGVMMMIAAAVLYAAAKAILSETRTE